MRLSTPYLASFFLAGLLGILTIFFRNYEFIFYSITVVMLVAILYATDNYFKYPKAGLWLFNVWLVLHIIGGLASYQGVRFYDLILLDIVGDPYQILKYDQCVHFYCYLVISILMWSIVSTITKPEASRVVVYVITVLATSSLGAVNEIIEFLAVVMFNATGVGGYINTAIDLVANLFGAMIGTLYMLFMHKKCEYD
jgi:putative membrane protein